jgi:sugar transferase (PEP-CTERM system associated)
MVQIFSQYVSRKTLLLSLVELLLIVVAVICGAKLRFWNEPAEFDSYFRFPTFPLQLITLIAAMELSFYYSNLYGHRTFRHRQEEFLSLAQSLGTASVCLGVLYWLVPSLLMGRGVFFLSLAIIAALIMLSRLVLDRAWRLAVPTENILILGTQEIALRVVRAMRERSDLNINLVGFVNPSQERGAGELAGLPVIGGANRLEQIVAENRVSRIVVAMEERRGGLPTRELVSLRVSGIQIEDAHSIMSSLSGRVWLETVRPSWFVFHDGFHRSKTTMVLKRLMDVLFSAVLLTIVSPIMLLVALIVRLESKGPVIYRQGRVGYRGKVFEVLKFRSMRTDAESAGAQWAKADDPRVTRVGGVLRKYRLDELPQLWNVLRGEMSFVGPRPERPYFVEQLREQISYYDERHSVRPGVTGWAQVQYQYSDCVEGSRRKLEYDLFYLKNMSMFFDFAIVFQTVQIIFTGSGSR